MLYYLFNYLNQHNFPGAGVFNYVTFRAAAAIIIALIVSVWFGNYFIKFLKRKNISETQRDASIDPYNTKKKGVPTMGGVIIITSILVPVLLVGKIFVRNVREHVDKCKPRFFVSVMLYQDVAHLFYGCIPFHTRYYSPIARKMPDTTPMTA